MSEDFVLETKDDVRLAPSSKVLDLDDTIEFEKTLQHIPDKMGFKIGEVAKLAAVKPYVLRYWESEFEALKPKKSRHNQRVYERRDVVTVLMIKKLLHEDRFSIEGAKTALRKLRKETKTAKSIRTMHEQVEDVTDQMHDLVDDIRRLKELFS